MKQVRETWAIKHSQENKLDGYAEHFDHIGLINCPVERSGSNLNTFRTRAMARQYVKDHYAYYSRPDLKAEPHGWHMPQVVRVRITVETI